MSKRSVSSLQLSFGVRFLDRKVNIQWSFLVMKPETRTSFLNKSFRRSFRRRKTEEKANAANPDEVEKKALSELRKSIDDVIQPYYTDVILHRFLRLKKFDVKEAEKTIRRYLNFRKLFNLNNLDNWKHPENLPDQNLSTVLGFDNEGALIRYINLGCGDVKGLVHTASTIEIIIIILGVIERDIETLKEENEKSGRNADQIVFIVDLRNLSTVQILHKPVIDLALMGLTLFQEHFFEIWKSIFIINAPSYFNTVYKLLRPSIRDELHSKVYVYNTENWKEALLLQISADVLPDIFGGTRVDYKEDPKHPLQLTEIVSIPASFYAGEDQFLNPSDSSVQTITVPAGGFVNIPIPVIVPGSYFKYHVSPKDHDVGIGVFYESNGSVCQIEKFKKKDNSKDALSKLEQLTPIIRCQCHIKPEIGEVEAWRAGIYILHFDNTYSWMNSKQVHYKVNMTAPESKNQNEASNIINDTKNLKL